MTTVVERTELVAWLIGKKLGMAIDVLNSVEVGSCHMIRWRKLEDNGWS